MSPKPGAMPVPISQAERWVPAGSDGRIRSSQASLSTGSRPPPAPPTAPRSGAALVDVSNRLLSSPAVGSARPAAPIPLFASPASQQPEKGVRLGLTGGRSHGVNQVRAALAAPFNPPVDASSFFAGQVGSRSTRIASSPSWQAPGGARCRSPVPRSPLMGNIYLERASISLAPVPLPGSGRPGSSPGMAATPRLGNRETRPPSGPFSPTPTGPVNDGTPRRSGRQGENLMEKFYQQKIKQLEEELARKEDVTGNKAARLSEQVQTLTNAQLVLEEQLRVLKRDQQTSRGRIQGLEKECTWGE